MATKQQIIKSLEDLPEDATIEDFMERLYVLYKVEQGLEDMKAGRTFTHEEVMERIRKWQR